LALVELEALQSERLLSRSKPRNIYPCCFHPSGEPTSHHLTLSMSYRTYLQRTWPEV